MPLVDLAPCDTSDSFCHLCEELHGWILRRIDLCGGWSQAMADASTPRTVGAYLYPADLANELHDVANQLGRLYSRLGKRIGHQIGTGDTTPLGRFQSAERDIILACLDNTSEWGTTLRADFLLENGRIRIVEVNSDAVAGVEDILLLLHFYSTRCIEHFKPIVQNQINRLHNSLVTWIKYHYECFKAHANLASDIHDPRIAVVYHDRDMSQSLGRYLCEVLRFLGFDAFPCRPEHLHFAGDRLVAESPVSGYVPVDIVWRHWLFFEMFDAVHGEKTLRAEFKALIAAIREQRVLALNPVHDRLLFSKDLLSQLSDKSPSILELDEDEKRFVSRYIVSTETFDDAVALDENVEYVVKPADEFGGRGVYFNGATKVGRKPMAADLDAGVWVRQPIVHGERISRNLRWSALQSDHVIASTNDLYIAHGLLVLNHHEPVLGGLMTRLGPDPIVNWSRGADIIPGLLAQELKFQLEAAVTG